MPTHVTVPLQRLAGALADLRARVRAALAGEVARAVAEAVREVVDATLRGGPHAPVPEDVRPDRSRRADPGRRPWDDPDPDPWDDRPGWGAADPGDERGYNGPHVGEGGADEPYVGSLPELYGRADPATRAADPAVTAAAPKVPAAVTAGVTAGRWWLRRRGSLVEAVGVGVAVALAVLAGGPVALAGAAVVTAAADLTAATDALGAGAARLDQF